MMEMVELEFNLISRIADQHLMLDSTCGESYWALQYFISLPTDYLFDFLQVFYHLGELNDSLSYALGAGPLFDVSEDSDYVHTILGM